MWWNKKYNAKLNISHFQVYSRLEKIQRGYQENKTIILGWENSRNHLKKQKTLGFNELYQEI